VTALGFTVAATAGDTRTCFGWTFGRGIQYAFTDMVSGRLKYRYVDLGSQNHLLVDSVKFNASIFRGAVEAQLTLRSGGRVACPG
jgi:outer membrane immunogenic protein